MIKPIVLTSAGETLLGYPGSVRGDEGELDNCIGVHDVCNGFVDIKKISTTHNAIICRSCHLRVIVPASLKTYGELRAYFHGDRKK